MRSRIIHTSENGQRTFALIMEEGEEVITVLTAFARKAKLAACQFTAIGAFSESILGYFDFAVKDFRRITVAAQTEVLIMAGDIVLDNEKQKIHAHVVLGQPDGSASGGHLLEGRVRPTLEVMLTESPAFLRRSYDPSSGLALINLHAPL